MADCVACKGIPVRDDVNNDIVFSRAYHELYEEYIERDNYCYRERDCFSERFGKRDREMVDESAHIYYDNCVAVSKMNVDEFVMGVLAKYDENKSEYDRRRIRMSFDALDKIPTELIKAYLTMHEG